MHSRLPTPPQFALERPGVDLVGVPLSDLVRLYLAKLDSRPYVACSELVEDQRRVSIRANEQLSRAAIQGLLSRHGYGFSTSNGVTYVCPIGQQASSGASMPVGSPLDASSSSAIFAQAEPAPLEPVYASAFQEFAQGGDTITDRLAMRGFEPAGCIDAMDSNKVRVSMRMADEVHFVDMDDVKKSKIADLVKCRL